MPSIEEKKNNNIHEHMRHVAHFNTALAAVSLLFILLLFIWLKWFYSPDARSAEEYIPANQPQVSKAVLPADAPSQEEIAENYRKEINSTIASFGFDDSAQAESLSYKVLELTVPGELKNFHLQVVVALNDAQQGKTKQARQRIEKLKTEYAWFLPDYK